LSTASWAQVPDPFPHIAQAYWLGINDEEVWSRHAERPQPMASLTKMMTALLVLEQSSTPDGLGSIVRASLGAVKETGTRIGLQAGDEFTVSDLLAATMIASANDACRALADHYGGNQKRFVQLMNARAQGLGMHSSRFTNACGHDAPGHVSTAQDLVLLARALLKHPLVLELGATPHKKISTRIGGKTFALINTNALIGRYPGAIGLKTGHTALAGNCLVALARRGDTEVLLILLKGANRWWDSVDLLDMAFERAKHAH
jgi:D-alanyl-D-alanine carboxypeptidase (penicillin-binding protein 5/6)